MANLSFRPEYEATPDLRRLLGKAILLSRESVDDRGEKMDVSFTTLLLAFFAAEDPVSGWFQRQASAVQLEPVLKSKGLNLDILVKVRGEPASEKLLDDQLPAVTASVNNLIDIAFGYARRIAPAISGESVGQSSALPDTRLDVRHILAAILYQPGRVHEPQLAQWGLDRRALAEAFLSDFAQLLPNLSGELPGWCAIYKDIFGTEAPACQEKNRDAAPERAFDRLPGYAADEASGEKDALKIDADVNALAALIAAHTTSAPLAVGVFGDWGSGKTFFMRRLMRRIDDLAKAARSESAPDHEKLQKDVAFYKHIVQIEFNAWHYEEGNLWASLVEHIFANLRLSQDKDWDPNGTRLEAIQDHLLAQLQVQERALALALAQATAKADIARQELQDATNNLARIKAERERRLQEMADVTLQDVLLTDNNLAPILGIVNQALSAAGFKEVSQSVKAVTAALTEARATMQHGGAVIMPLLQGLRRRRRFALLLLALAGGPLIGLLASLLARAVTDNPLAEQLARVSGTIGAVAGIITEALRRGSQWTAERLAKIEEANQELCALQRAKSAEYNVKVAHLQEQLTRLNADYLAAQQCQEAAQRRLEEISRELRENAPGRRLVRYIEDRTNSDDYRKHLGILALIRRDFGTISDYINLENRRVLGLDQLDAEKVDNDKRINRIVLYIDDLDRCPTDKVVQVLQAIHLLSVFPLFVIVVGVDARWVSHALRDRYRRLLKADSAGQADEGALAFGRDATPHDYLEKIFQIPIWLRPMDRDGSTRMLDTMLTGMVVADPVAAPVTSPNEQLAAHRQNGAVQTGERATSPAGDHGNSPPDRIPAPGPAAEPPEQPLDLAPESLRIYRSEFDFMEDLAPILGRSPRAIKRFVNLYRLVKVALEPSEYPIVVDPSQPVGDDKIVMFLLGVVTGLPSISREFFRTLRQNGRTVERAEETGDRASGSDRRYDLREAFARMKVGLLPGDGWDLHRLRGWLDSYRQGAWWDVPLVLLAARAPQVARYSFRVEEFQPASGRELERPR